MQITFYVLNATPASAHSEQEAFLAFVCRLTETVLKKSDDTLVILDDDIERLQNLDKQLWAFSAVSFVPHDLCIQTDSTQSNKSMDESNAPVILTNSLPVHFDGVVLNLATKPLNLSNLTDTSTKDASIDDDGTDSQEHNPQRLLEIIAADKQNKQKGREKYRHYQRLGYQLQVHKIG